MDSIYRQSISARLRWSYLISSTLPLLIVGALLIVLNFRAQQRMVYNEQVSQATRAARDISAYISGVEARVLRLGQMLHNDTPLEQLELTASDLNALALLTLVVLDANGETIAYFPQDQAFSAQSADTYFDDPLILSALQGRGGRSDIRRTDGGQAIFTTVLPLRNRGVVTGVIRADVNATPIEEALRPLSARLDTVTYLINDQREVMLSSTTSGWKPATDLAALFESGAEIAQYDSGNGQTVVGARASISPSNWWVIVEQPARVAFANVRRSVLLLALLVTVAGLLALGVGLWQAQKILRPLKDLREGAIKLGAGQLEHRINVQSTDEMGQLAQTFNQMAEHLQASLSEIEHQNDRLRNGLILARDIQLGLLPTSPPWNHKMLSVQARSIPAYEVGGDFYSYLALPNDHAAIAVGDISGKGVAAALLMALTSSMVESQARNVEMPSEVFRALNDVLSPRLKSNRMNAALIYAVFNLQAHTMTVANAGMIAPFLIRAQHADSPMSCELIEVGGLPIGSLPYAFYQDVTVNLAPNDTILFLSDGVVEAKNEKGELFGFDRLEAAITDVPISQDPAVLVTLILQRVQEFIGQAEQHDDITIVAVRPTLLPKTTHEYDTSTTMQAVPLHMS